MYTRTYKVAEHVFTVCSQYADVHRFCAEYATDEPSAFTIAPTAADVAYERQEWEKCVADGAAESAAVSDGALETLAVHRALAEHCTRDGYLLFHGSAIAVDGETYLFTAPSGTGKSTHTRLWRERFGDRAEMVNDDKPFLKITDSGVTVFGSPWNGKHRLGGNIARPLKAVILLERDTTDHIEPIDAREAFPVLYRQSYSPPEPVATAQVMRMLGQLCHHAALYRLGCTMRPEAAAVSYNGMNAKEELSCD